MAVATGSQFVFPPLALKDQAKADAAAGLVDAERMQQRALDRLRREVRDFDPNHIMLRHIERYGATGPLVRPVVTEETHPGASAEERRRAALQGLRDYYTAKDYWAKARRLYEGEKAWEEEEDRI